ncbi:flagellar hook-length control protein FliK [Minwuia sp.]|uniref:flagellar hook-length control protein FliK n=1 Tax=Minwuia sp. TaxID=2493630 RepID=UPI003A91934C
MPSASDILPFEKAPAPVASRARPADRTAPEEQERFARTLDEVNEPVQQKTETRDTREDIGDPVGNDPLTDPDTPVGDGAAAAAPENDAAASERTATAESDAAPATGIEAIARSASAKVGSATLEAPSGAGKSAAQVNAASQQTPAAQNAQPNLTPSTTAAPAATAAASALIAAAGPAGPGGTIDIPLRDRGAVPEGIGQALAKTLAALTPGKQGRTAGGASATPVTAPAATTPAATPLTGLTGLNVADTATAQNALQANQFQLQPQTAPLTDMQVAAISPQADSGGTPQQLAQPLSQPLSTVPGVQSAGSATGFAQQLAQATAQPPAQQLGLSIARGAREGMDRIEIQLHPSELGRVDVRMELGHDGRIMAVVSAERSETLEQLRRDVHQLERALADAGFDTDSDSFQFQDRDQRQASGGRGPDGGEPDLTDGDIPHPSAIAARTLHFDGLGVDISV